MSSKLTMKDVMAANCRISNAEMLTSNHCAALARELNSILAAPVVERQLVEGYLPKDGGWSFKRHDERTIVIMNGENWTCIQADKGPIYEQFLYRFCESKMDQVAPELAELQATIARLTAENERLKKELGHD